MSEPTPLSAEEPYSRDELVHLAENMRHSIVQQIVGATEQKTINRLLATIDAQATEIEGYRQALAQRGHVAEFREDGWSLEHPVECRAIGLIDCAVNLACGYEQTAPQLGRFVVTVNEDGFLVLGERVLAGKEAQGD